MYRFFARPRLLAAPALLLAATGVARAETYYFSPSGGAGNAGTSPASPFSIGQFDGLTLRPGDSALFEGGATHRGNLYLAPEDSGNDAAGNLIAPITLGSYGTGRATIDAGDSFGLFAFNNGGFDVRDLNFRGSGVAANGATTSTGDGLNFFTDLAGNVKQNHIYLNRVDVAGFGGRGVSIGGFNGGTAYNDVRVTNSALHDNRKSGLLTFAQNRAANTNVLVDNVRAFDNVGDPSSTGNTGSGIVLGNVDGGVVQNSVAYRNGRNNKPTEGPVGIWTYDSNDVTIQFNESYDNTTSNGDGGGFDLDQNVTNSVLQYNYSHGNAGAGYLVFDGDGTAVTNSGNVVRYNVSENDGRRNNGPAAGITVGGNVRDLEVYGNTVFTDAPAVANGTNVPAIKIDTFGATSPTGVLVANNIFQTDDGSRLVFVGNGVNGGGIAFNGNDYFSTGDAFVIRYRGQTYATLAAWRAATGQEMLDGAATGFALDPMLTAPGEGGTADPDAPNTLTAYLLRDDSPLIDLGLDYARFGIDPGARDFFGNAIPQGRAFDIGAHEFAAPAAIPEPSAVALLAVGLPALALRRRR